MGLVAVVPFILPESCRWLISQGDGNKSVKIIKKIAKMNNKEVPDHVISEVIELCEKQKEENDNSSPISYMDLFRTKNMRKITILISILYMLISLENDNSSPISYMDL